ncbi:MAG: VWA domain-containing protein [Chloroflexi bacterium]|nr:VWA domain-containing protein [Chloroflexota bacterium]
MIEFANPLALLWLLALAPAGAAAWYASRLRQRADAAFGGGAELRSGQAQWRRPLQLGLLLAALGLAAIAVARPQGGAEERVLTRLGVDVAIALDISRSMTTQDVQPSRAEVAAWGLTEMLAHLRGDRVGLVTFAGEAFQRSPLTLDLEPLTQLIARSQNEAALVAQGTDLGAALSSAIDLLDVDDPADTQVVVLISDGEDVGGAIDAAIDEANELGIRIYTVAVGTAEGGSMPGVQAAASRVDVAALGNIAERTGGDVRPLGAIAGLAVEFQRLRRSAFDEGANEAAIDRFQWFLGGALVLLLAQSWVASGARTGARLPAARIVLGATGLLGALLVAACGSAAYEDVQRGNEAYDQEAYEEALAAYQEAAGETSDAAEAPPPIGYNIGNTLHRLERYEEATVATTAAMTATDDPALLTQATYAAGSHAFKRGDLEAAREAYIGVLLRDPGDVDAKHNLEVVLRLLGGDEPPPPAGQAPRRPEEGDEPDGQAEPEPGDPDEDPQDDGGGDGDPGDEPPEDDDTGGEGEPGEEGDQPPEDGESDTPPRQPGDAPGEPDPAAPDNVDDAREQLSAAILELGDAPLTLEQALQILDLVRITNSLEALEPPERTAGGALPDR